ncbi:MAG: hypothetical protein ACI85N_002365, partial [Gammaproteobacteria bacterium]
MKYINHFIIFVIAILLQNTALASEVQDKQSMELDALVYLEQNWSDADRDWFYFIDQGSRLMPYRIFKSLEQTNNENLLSDSYNLLRFGFLSAKKSKNNPDGLPVGFTIADGYLGLNCAACHTQQLKYKDKFVRIDGGQSMMDLSMFLSVIEASM